MNAPSLLGFVLFFLSFLKIQADGAASFIALDFASALYFLIHPSRLLRYSSILKWFVWALIALIGTRALVGASEFVFLARLILIFIDAFFLAELFKVRGVGSRETICSHVLWLAALAYLGAFILWLGMPDGTESFFYLNSRKAWIATFPALFAVSHLIAGRQKQTIFWALMAAALSLVDTNTSRVLLLQSLLLFLIAVWQVNRRLAIVGAIFACLSALFFLSSIGTFVEIHDHSNTFRLVMIMQIFDFSAVEIVFGRGIDMWGRVAFGVLFDMPGAEAFFESANPHFFPAELVIRGGISLFILACCAFYAAFRRSRLMVIPLVMLLATFFTTNTGVERLYMTLALFILISNPSSYKPRKL
jgi:hypothetical protein